MSNVTKAKSAAACTKKAKTFLADKLGLAYNDVKKGVHFEVRQCEIDAGMYQWHALGNQTEAAEIEAVKQTIAQPEIDTMSNDDNFDEVCKVDVKYNENGDAVLPPKLAAMQYPKVIAGYAYNSTAIATPTIELVAPEIEWNYCPTCGVHLSNGIGEHLQVINGKAIHHKHFEFECLACNAEFGNPIKKRKSARKTSNITGVKIQKVRIEQNGIKRPSEGTKCAQLWEMFETMQAENGGAVPTPKPAKDRSATLGMDPTTTTVQLYKWREFMGYKGR